MTKQPIEILQEMFEMCVEMRKMHMDIYDEFFKKLSIINQLPIISQKQLILSIYEFFYHSNKEISELFIQIHKNSTNTTLDALDKYTNHPKGILTEDMINKLKSILTANEQKLLSFEKTNTKYYCYIMELESILVSKFSFSEKD